MNKNGQNLGEVLLNMNRSEKIRKCIAGLLALLMITILFAFYNQANREDTQRYEQQIMQKLTEECAQNVSGSLSASLNTLKTTSKYASTILKIGEYTPKVLKELEDNSTIDHLLYVDRYGQAMDSSGNEVNVAQTQWFKNALNNKSGTVPDHTFTESGVLFYTPIRENNKNTGVLAACVPLSKIEDRLSFELAGVQSDGCLFTTDGTLSACTKEGISIRGEALAALSAEKQVQFYRDGDMQCALYPLEEDVVLFQELPLKVVASQSNAYANRSIRFALMSFAVFILYGLYSAHLNAKTRKELVEDRNTYIEVLGGIAESFDYVGVFDLARNRFTEVSGQNLKKYGINDGDTCDEVFRKASRFLQHPDLAEKTMESVFNREYLLSHIHERGESLYFEYYNAREENKYKGVTVYCLESFEHHPLRLLFAARDLSAHKMEERRVKEQLKDQQKALQELATHDPLTGALNRNGFAQSVQRHKLTPEVAALVLIDLDKFKTFNDTYGHEIGDQILVKLATVLGKYFKQTDDIIRFGGDEFAVLLHDYQDEGDAILRYITSINKELSHPEDGLPAFSISAGFAVSKDGYSEELYRKADLALYKVKENGRCGCMQYTENAE